MVTAIKSVEQLIVVSKIGVQAITIPKSVILELFANKHNTEQNIDEFAVNFQKKSTNE